jgi:hypothetical protein
MTPTPHYRYIRGLPCSTSLYAVTPSGIEDFLSAPEAAHPGVVVLFTEGDDEEPARVLGGPRVGEILRYVGSLGGRVLAEARPLAVMTLDAWGADPDLGRRVCRRLSAMMGNDPAGDADAIALGRYEALVADAPDAVSRIIGADPFAAPPTLN